LFFSIGQLRLENIETNVQKAIGLEKAFSRRKLDSRRLD
jgi:hypothetical protein